MSHNSYNKTLTLSQKSIILERKLLKTGSKSFQITLNPVNRSFCNPSCSYIRFWHSPRKSLDTQILRKILVKNYLKVTKTSEIASRNENKLKLRKTHIFEIKSWYMENFVLVGYFDREVILIIFKVFLKFYLGALKIRQQQVNAFPTPWTCVRRWRRYHERIWY